MPTSEPKGEFALCLSGGGYRAMLFHLGALWRLNEVGYLPRLTLVSSVSGGSITAGVLGTAWSRLAFDKHGVARKFDGLVTSPLRALAGRTIDTRALLKGIFSRQTIPQNVRNQLRRRLFRRATLQDLPEHPEFRINATNVQTGELWTFSHRWMGCARVGRVEVPMLDLADAVAASCAFPPVLSPFELTLEDLDFEVDVEADLQKPPYTTHVVLTDGGVYDNLGLTAAWESSHTILASDAICTFEPDPEPDTDWPRHSYRVVDLIMKHAQARHKKRLLQAFRSGDREGAYWGIRSDITKFPVSDPLDCSPEVAAELAQILSRLGKMDAETQERLINWGYAICDAALRGHVDPSLPRPEGFPYKRGV